LGIGYVFASLLAWTGFGNLYRYSPTLFLGSRSYRQAVARGSIGKEGRDPQSLWIGVLFGLSLLGTAFALSDAISAAIAIVVVIIVVAAYFRLIPTPVPPPSNP
jgi:cobalamin synthase